MRDFKGMKRQRGRSRSSGKPQQNANRAFDSNGPEGIKVRGAAQSVYEKYQQLARDSQTAGDRVLAENYLQHAEHYFRLLRTIQPQRPLAEIIGRDQFASGYDLDFEEDLASAQGEADPSDGSESDAGAESGAVDARFGEARPGEARLGEARPGEARTGEDRRRDDRARDDRFRDERQRDDRRRDDRSSGEKPRDNRGFDDRSRDDRSRDDRSRDDRSRDDRNRDNRSRDNRSFDDRSRAERPRDDRHRDERDRPRDERTRDSRPTPPQDRGERTRQDRDVIEPGDRPQPADPLAVVEPRGGSFKPAPSGAAASILRAEDGDVSHAPAFLNLRSPAPAGEEVADRENPGGDDDAASPAADTRSSGRRRRTGGAGLVAEEG